VESNCAQFLGFFGIESTVFNLNVQTHNYKYFFFFFTI
jgi:hypothetical protein